MIEFRCSKVTRNHHQRDCATCGYCAWHCTCNAQKTPMTTHRVEPVMREAKLRKV